MMTKPTSLISKHFPNVFSLVMTILHTPSHGFNLTIEWIVRKPVIVEQHWCHRKIAGEATITSLVLDLDTSSPAKPKSDMIQSPLGTCMLVT